MRKIGVNIINGFLSKFRTQNPSLQEFYFKIALKEFGINNGAVRINHKEGKNWHNKTGWINIVFPEQYIKLASSKSIVKKEKYFFKGLITAERAWVKNYIGVEHSARGRDPNLKYVYDSKYLESLSRAEFGISPTGDCPWSYRFFESIMCMAIPVLGVDELDIFSSAFDVLRDGQVHIYDRHVAISNFEKFRIRHTLSGILSEDLG